eukprot:COSAG05_NODE_6531_length_942_cov_4.269276_2_plen_47_part_01
MPGNFGRVGDPDILSAFFAGAPAPAAGAVAVVSGVLSSDSDDSGSEL